MRIGFISHWYDPEGGAAAGPGTLTRALVARGHQVDVVTGFPIYPHGRVFDGYRLRPYQREVMEGVTVHRSPIYPSHDDRAAHRMANYLSFAASGSMTALMRLGRSDAAFVYSSPATVGAAGVLLRRLAGIPFVMQVQDLWPDTVTSSGFVEGSANSRMDKILGPACQLVYRNAHTVAVISPGMADVLAERGVPREKIALLPNWAEERSFHPVDDRQAARRELGLDDNRFVAMYAGNLGEQQALHTVIEAAQRLRGQSNIHLVLLGAGVAEQRLRDQVAQLRLSNVTFLPPRPFAQMSQVLSAGDVQLVSLKDIPLYRITLPSKLQAGLAAGRPVIAAVAGDGGQLVEDAGAGFSTRPEDPDALAEAIRRMAAMTPANREAMGRRGREHYLAHYSESVVGDTLSGLLQAAAGSRS